jgi:hypothetical protein
MFSQYKLRLPWLKNKVIFLRNIKNKIIIITTTVIVIANEKLEYIHPGICYVSVQFLVRVTH